MDGQSLCVRKDTHRERERERHTNDMPAGKKEVRIRVKQRKWWESQLGCRTIDKQLETEKDRAEARDSGKKR